ncbi:24766_t:CDS:10 [Dentiscutata erythropus]|uniref:24766_t:CDS:1 n=1 Tax=Dentiscutata erythropus TaxID=1348616 RepID=A0A9N8VBM2_9GLOM|nr:24766_t:CDS:10 [Dentiscutata erythropus]
MFISENNKIECIKLYLESNFNNWTSGNALIDQLLRNFIRSGSEEIILKSLNNSDDPNIEYFNEAVSHIIFSSLGSLGVKCYGLTKFSENLEYVLILKYMKGGDLNSFIFNENNKFGWKQIYSLFQQILKELIPIHNSNMALEQINNEEILLPELELKPSLPQTNSFNTYKSVNFNFKDKLNLGDDVDKSMHKNNIGIKYNNQIDNNQREKESGDTSKNMQNNDTDMIILPLAEKSMASKTSANSSQLYNYYDSLDYLSQFSDSHFESNYKNLKSGNYSYPISA